MVVVCKYCYTGSITSGIAQGSVHGPFLFLLYASDLGDGIKSSMRLFADNIIPYSVIITPTDSIQLQNDLKTLESWESRWQTPFNPEKCHQLTVTKKRNRILTSNIICNQTFERVAIAQNTLEKS